MNYVGLILGGMVAALAYDRLRVMTWRTHPASTIIAALCVFVWGVGAVFHAFTEPLPWFSLVGLVGVAVGLLTRSDKATSTSQPIPLHQCVLSRITGRGK
jgi:xanthine/uracil permease